MAKNAIVKLEWDETSGVDHSANLTEGWAVMKSADGTLVDAEALLKADVDFIYDLQALDMTLEWAKGAFKDDETPEDIRMAFGSVSAWTKTQLAQYLLDEADEVVAEMAPSTEATATAKRRKSIVKLAKGLVDRLLTKRAEPEVPDAEPLELSQERQLELLQKHWTAFVADINKSTSPAEDAEALERYKSAVLAEAQGNS